MRAWTHRWIELVLGRLNLFASCKPALKMNYLIRTSWAGLTCVCECECGFRLQSGVTLYYRLCAQTVRNFTVNSLLIHHYWFYFLLTGAECFLLVLPSATQTSSTGWRDTMWYSASLNLQKPRHSHHVSTKLWRRPIHTAWLSATACAQMLSQQNPEDGPYILHD